MKWQPDDYLLFRPPPGSRDVRSPYEKDIYATAMANIALQKAKIGPRPVTGVVPAFEAPFGRLPLAACEFKQAFLNLWSSPNVDSKISLP